MARLPFIKWFPNDWLAEPSVRACSIAARGLWIDLLSLMHLSPRRGYLLAATGSPLSPEQIARMTGCSAEEATRLLAELHSSGVYSCTDDGTIYSRRMVRDEGKREKCADAGRKGGILSAGKRKSGPSRVTLKGDPQGSGDFSSTLEGKVKGQVKGEVKGQVKPPEARGQTKDNSAAQSSPLDAGPPSRVDQTGKIPDTDHHRAIAAFCESWQAKYGQKYPFNAGKDAMAVKWMLAQVGGDANRFAAVVGRYLADDDPFYAENRHDIGTMRAKFARWLIESAPRGGQHGSGAYGRGDRQSSNPSRVDSRPGDYDAPNPRRIVVGIPDVVEGSCPAGDA